MITRIHHLDCCSMCPMGGSWAWGPTGGMCGHVLLLETASQGLVLVDTGVGLADRRNRAARLGPVAVLGGFPTVDEGAAVHEIRALGLDPSDVRHVVLTHFDLDHAGGIGDVPDATVHLLEAEADAARTPTAKERTRYRRAHVDAVRHWRPYAPTGEAWRGFPAAMAVEGLADEVLLVPLTGHSRGHAAVAVKSGDGWLLHAGDAYFHRNVLTGGSVPLGPRAFERLAAHDWSRVQANHQRLAEVVQDESDVRVFSAHDPAELEALRSDSA